jgi:hypothetical protein
MNCRPPLVVGSLLLLSTPVAARSAQHDEDAGGPFSLSA